MAKQKNTAEQVTPNDGIVTTGLFHGCMKLQRMQSNLDIILSAILLIAGGGKMARRSRCFSPQKPRTRAARRSAIP